MPRRKGAAPAAWTPTQWRRFIGGALMVVGVLVLLIGIGVAPLPLTTVSLGPYEAGPDIPPTDALRVVVGAFILTLGAAIFFGPSLLKYLRPEK